MNCSCNQQCDHHEKYHTEKGKPRGEINTYGVILVMEGHKTNSKICYLGTYQLPLSQWLR